MHITKPVDPYELVSTVEQLAHGSRGSPHARG
jgi:hypothetical protein